MKALVLTTAVISFYCITSYAFSPKVEVHVNTQLLNNHSMKARMIGISCVTDENFDDKVLKNKETSTFSYKTFAAPVPLKCSYDNAVADLRIDLGNQQIFERRLVCRGGHNDQCAWVGEQAGEWPVGDTKTIIKMQPGSVHDERDIHVLDINVSERKQ